jgi:Ca-activated chloride channel family protein
LTTSEARPGVAVVLLCILSLSICAQEPNQQVDDVVRVSAALVTIPLVVTDKRGRRIPNIKKSSLVLREDGRPATIESFSAGAESLALAFALDVSGSTREVISQQRSAAVALLARFGNGSLVSVTRFDDKPTTVVPFTSDVNEAVKAFQTPSFPEHRTAIFDACLHVIREYKHLSPRSGERRILILISDGLDTASRTSPDLIVSMARELNVSIYVIQIPLFSPRDGRLEPRPTANGFRELGGNTGGQSFIVGDRTTALSTNPVFDLGPVFKSIADDLASQYIVGFNPSVESRDGRTHRFEITTVDERNQSLRVKLLRNPFFVVIPNK